MSSNELLQVEESRNALDAEIALLQARICALKMKRNQLAEISRLPTETLCKIFLECRDLWEGSDICHNVPHKVDDTHWTAITYVCRQWREISLGYPALWAHLYSSIPSYWLGAAYSRSKGAALNIDCDNIDPTSLNDVALRKLAVFSRAMTQTSRLERIFLDGPERLLKDLLAPLTSPLPILDSLSIFNGSSNVTTLPEPFLGHHAPRLRILQIRGFHVPRDLTHFGELTCLMVSHEHGYDFPPPLARDFLITLSAMTALTTLTLNIRFPIMTTSIQVELPLVEIIRLRGTCFECTTLLNHVRTPTARIVNVDCTGVDVLFSIAALGSALSSAVLSLPQASSQERLPRSQLLRTLNIHDGSTPSEIGVWASSATTDQVDNEAKSENIDLMVSINLSTRRFQWPVPINQVLQGLSLPLANFTHVMLEDFSLGRTHGLQRSLAMLPSIETLESFGDPYDIFMNFLLGDPALRHTSNNTHPQTPSVTRLPRLQTISLKEVAFRRAKFDINHIIALCKSRAIAGAKIKEIQFTGCDGPYDADLKRLREVVDCVRLPHPTAEVEVESMNGMLDRLVRVIEDPAMYPLTTH